MSRATPKVSTKVEADTYDTIDWLVKNVPNNNGRVGLDGISYDGFLVTMGMINPHPALKAASEQACMGDTWLGDDFFHNGAFRLSYAFEYTALLESSNENFSFGIRPLRRLRLLSGRLGALGNANAKYFHGELPTWNEFVAHASYDDFWKRHAVAYGLKGTHRSESQRRRLVGPGGFLRSDGDLCAA